MYAKKKCAFCFLFLYVIVAINSLWTKREKNLVFYLRDGFSVEVVDEGANDACVRIDVENILPHSVSRILKKKKQRKRGAK